ncbi:MAG TPA: polysaccharide lyase family protein [Verrucomicrobiae bacterium]|nr:polysaccharide lyase family protein [Verrucomicrobiae bacterium]
MQKPSVRSLAYSLVVSLACLNPAIPASANIPGGGTGSGPDVTLVNNGNGTVTMANGIVSILCSTSSASINQINYTSTNSGATVTNQLLAGGTDGGKLYWETGGFGTGSFSYSAAANTGNYCEMDLLSASATSGAMDVHFSMLRGSPGFYVTAIFAHRSQDAAMGMGETRDNIYAGAIFNWMSVDAARNKLMEVQPGSGAVGMFGAPVECSLWTNGVYEGRYEDKYKYSADFGAQRVWGWSSVGAAGADIGLWQVTASPEYYSDGPMKRDLMSHIGTTILNYFESSHYGSAGTDGNWSNGEVWTKVYGPYFIYCNSITRTAATNQAAQMLYTDALAQASAEATAWPYQWFTNSNYALAPQRGAISGQIVINDSENPNANASNLWVGVVQQPATSQNVYDFQQWMKTCQFWTKTGSNGAFTILNVSAGTNYTLFAFGPGAAGTFQSQALAGGGPPNTVDIPASQFSVTVPSGSTNNIGAVTWTPARVGPTVFEIGYPDRTGAKFRHGEDYWVGDIGPSPVAPMPIWSKFLEYPFDFPNGPNYVVGQSRWTTDWNFVQPVVTDQSGNYDPSTSTITFNLATAPATGATASLYIALASDYQGALIVSLNGNNLGTTSGATSIPNANGANGFFPAYSGSGNESDTTVREGINSVSSDERITFPASLLNAGQNTITITMRKGGYFANHAMYDCIRLEMTGYIPPAPATVAAYPGNNCNLICWPVTPGATSYNVLRSTSSGSGYVAITNGVVGPVCGSGWNNATWVDNTAVNGTQYYYVVQSVNPVGASANSSQSSGVTPSSGLSTAPPLAPAGLTISSVGHETVNLGWNPSNGANYYTIFRSTLYDNGGGASNVLNTIVLANNVTGDSYTDTSPTDGSIYSYSVTATSSGGTSGSSAPAAAVPLPSPPSTAPANVKLTAGAGQTNYFITWSPVPGAVGYIVSRSASSSIPLNYGTYVMTVTETNWNDTGLSASGQYFYMITAVNAAGTASSSVISGPPGVPATLGATGGNGEVLLNWSGSTGANSYTILRGTSSGAENTVVATGVNATTYIDSGLNNGTTYYYVVKAVGASGTSAYSPQASATPNSAGISGLVWTGNAGSAWNTTAMNWLNGMTAATYADGDTVTFNDSAADATVTITNAVSPAYILFSNAALSYALTSSGGGISGVTSLIKTNTGSLTLNGANAYSGGTYLDGGTLVLNNASAAGSGMIVLNGGTLTLGAVINNAIDVTGSATLLPGTIDYNDSPLSGGGLLNISITGGNTFSPQADMSGFSGTNELGASTGFYRFYGSLGSSSAAFDLGTGTAAMSNRNGGVTIALGSLAGGSKTALSGAGSVNAPTIYLIGGNNNSATFSGKISDSLGSTEIIKTGAGNWTITGTNTYSAGTVVSNGTLVVNSIGGSGTGSGSVNVNGGVLAGTGTISGNVTINSGGTLAPGNPLGALTISNSLTLASGSVTIVQVQHSPPTNSSVTVLAALSENGTLIVTNSNASAFAAGDSFEVFNAAAYSGSFANLILPPLSAGLAWNTSALNVSGTVSVVALTSPLVSSVKEVNGNLVVAGTGGPHGLPYDIQVTTNLVFPQWMPLATNQFDAAGNFTFTNAINSGWPQTYYRLEVQ